MSKMNLPGFNAELSLYNSCRKYSVPNVAIKRSNSEIVPHSGFGISQKIELAAKTVIDIEPEECITRCFYFRGVRLFCYEVCF